MTIKPNTWLRCGCCGTAFQTWEGYVDQDQDVGYGICERCQGSIEESNRKYMDRAIETLRSGLNDENRAKFDAMDRDLQEAFVMEAISDGVMKFVIGGEHE